MLSEENGLADLIDKIGIFDQAYCSVMKDDHYMKELVTDPWDTYRDLDKVFKDEVSQENGF